MRTGRHTPRVGAKKIAISLPTALFREVERARRETGVGRSTLVQRALKDFIVRRERAALIERYVESYRTAPEHASEVDVARAAAADLLAREPWE